MLDVIFEDNHMLVVNKPAGVLTQPSGTEQESLEAIAKQWLKEKYQKPGNVFLEAVHRIDKPVSGIVLFARTSKGLSRLNASLRDKKSQKVYLALVEGVPQAQSGILEHYLVHDDFQARVVLKQDPQGKLARLHYKILERQGNQTLIEIILDTGRYHQIRAQLAAIGCPICGDARYGASITFSDSFRSAARQAMQPGKIALHHWRLSIPHPITGDVMDFEAPRPQW